MHPNPENNPSAFAQQSASWQAGQLDQDLAHALRQQFPAQAPGTMTARVLARLAERRWQAEQRHRHALALVGLSFAFALLSWLILVAWDVGVGVSLLALLGALVAAACDVWVRAQRMRTRIQAGNARLSSH